MRSKTLTMSLVLVTVLSLTACGEEELPSAQEIVDGAIESLDDIKSHKFDMGVSLEMAEEAEGESVEMSMVASFSGAVDLENKEMSSGTAISTVMPEAEEEMVGEMYIIDGMMYVMAELPGEGPVWEKEEFSEVDWEMVPYLQLPVESHLDLLETADVSVIGSEKVKGVDCYVLKLTPDLEQLWSTATERTPWVWMYVPYVAEDILEEAFTSFSVKQWVTKDTYFLTKSEIDISVEITTPELMGITGGEGMVTMGITISFLVYDHNQPVSIVVPPEAEEASDSAQQGREEAPAKTELANIQNAVIAMMLDNEIAYLPNPVTVATNDMSAFPDTSVCGVDKINDSAGNAYVNGQDKDGYILYLLDRTGDSAQTGLVNYVASQYTTGTYTVDRYGTMTQVTTGLE